MIDPVTEVDRQKYRQKGYHIIPKVIPASLLKNLRGEAAKAEEIARRIDGPQSQRLSVLHSYHEELEMKVYQDFEEIEGLKQAVQDLLTPARFLQPTGGRCPVARHPPLRLWLICRDKFRHSFMKQNDGDFRFKFC